jgi:hypothetical protein
MTESISDLTYGDDSQPDPDETKNGNPGRPQHELDVDDKQSGPSDQVEDAAKS